MKILLISHLWPKNPQSDNPLSGNYVKEQVDELRNLCEIDVFVPIKLLPLPKEIVKRNINFFRRVFFKQKNIKTVKYFPFLTKHIGGIIIALLILLRNRKKYNIIHAHTLFPDGYAAYILSKILKIPYVITIHGSDIMLIHKRKMDKILSKKIFENAKTVICVSKKISNIIHNDISENVNTIIIRNGIKKQFQLTKNNKELLFVGKLIDIKDPLLLIDIFKGFHEKNKEYKLQIVGDGPLRGKMENEIQKYSLQDFIIMNGFINRDKIHSFFERASFLLITSKSEGFPTIIPEAFSSGLPVISFDIGGIKEVIINKQNGYIVKNRNKNEFVEKLLESVSIEWDRESIRKESEQYLWSNIALEIYNKVYK